MKYVSCTPIIDYGAYVQAIYKEWDGKKLIFEGKVCLHTVCRVREKYQDKYPGSFKDGIISGIQEDENGGALFWLCFPAEVKGLFYASEVSYHYIDWDEYFRFQHN